MSLALEDGLVCGTPNPSGMEGVKILKNEIKNK
jgi:hypothetical protein